MGSDRQVSMSAFEHPAIGGKRPKPDVKGGIRMAMTGEIPLREHLKQGRPDR